MGYEMLCGFTSEENESASYTYMDHGLINFARRKSCGKQQEMKK
jgi:hypothetical protein